MAIFAVASLFAARSFLPLDIPLEALLGANHADFPQQFYWSTAYVMDYTGYYLGLLTALPVVLPVLIERAAKGDLFARAMGGPSSGRSSGDRGVGPSSGSVGRRMQ